MKIKSLFVLCFLILHSACCLSARAQGTAFTYQGRLNDGANPANGSYDFMCKLYDVLSNQVSITITNSSVPVSNGLFTTTLDFGSAFAGDPRWLNLWVRSNGGGAFTALAPGQRITAAPYALTAEKVTGLIPDSQITGPILRTTFNGAYTGQLVFTPAGVAPFAVGSTNKVNDLNADLLDGLDSSAFWKLGGNAGTTPGTHFLGTTDNQALELKVNDAIALRIEPAPNGPNMVGGLAAIRPTVIASGVRGAVVAGGAAPAGPVSGLGAGDFHAVYDSDGTIGGGFGNKVGTDNLDVDDAPFGTVAGGVFNGASGYAATVAGGDGNLAGGTRAAILGGGANQALAQDSAVGGGQNNLVQTGASSSVIGGGGLNRILRDSPVGTIAGGQANTINSNSPYATIGGGTNNSIGEYSAYGTIAGGGLNRLTYFGQGGTISGGIGNQIDSDTWQSVIGGGYVNHIYDSANNAVIGGGYANEARGARSVVPGGSYNIADGAHSFAAGYNARALHEGCFVWSDAYSPLFFNVPAQSTSSNQFVIRASGGIQVHPNTSQFFGSQTRQMLNLWGTLYGIGVQSYTMYSRTDVGGGFAWFQGGTHNDSQNNAGGGTLMMRLDSAGSLFTAGAVNPPSDRHAKENFKPVDPRAVLDKVAALPLSEWNYKADAATRHVGPMAQDFHAAFGLGTDDKHIATVDADGVALAAIQGLNEKVESGKQKAEIRIQKLEAENAELKQRLERLETLLAQHIGGAQ